MGLAHSPRIVTSNLTLYIDGVNPRSYVTPNTTWRSLANNAMVFNITGANTYNTISGAIEFTALSGTALTPTTITPVATNLLTVSAWVRVKTTHGDWNNYIRFNWVSSGWALYSSTTDWIFGIAQSSVKYEAYGPHNSSNQWTHLVGTYDGSTVRLYVNGVQLATTASISNAVLDTNKQPRLAGTSDPGNKEIALLSVYDRALSQSEIIQLFNAHRGRFGI